MMRTLAAIGLMSGVMLGTSLAKAEAKGAFGQQGEFILSADRLVPLFSFVDISQEQTGPLGPGVSKVNQTTQFTSLSLLQGGVPGTQAEAAFFAFPRIGFDYVVASNITIGGDILFYTTLGGHSSTETDFTNGTTTTTTVSAPSTLAFGIAPRGGYILPLSDLFSLWLRGRALTFYTASNEDADGRRNLSPSRMTRINSRSTWIRTDRPSARLSLRHHGRPHGRHPAPRAVTA